MAMNSSQEPEDHSADALLSELPHGNDEPARDEAYLDDVVSSYIQNQIQVGAAAGKSTAEIEESLNAASMILTVRMLQSWGDGVLPEGAELLRALGDVTGASEAECRDICHVFVAAGWLDAAYTLTDKGRKLAGI